MNTHFAKDIIDAAKSSPNFDKVNAEAISSYHGVSFEYVLKEILFVRKNLMRIVK